MRLVRRWYRVPGPAKPQNTEGTPHFTYVDAQLSFTWDGISPWIEVRYGDNDSVFDRITTQVSELGLDTSFGWLTWFKDTCDAYITIKRNL
jgi:hypothetical protein